MDKSRIIKSMVTIMSIFGLFFTVYLILKNEHNDQQIYSEKEAIYLQSDAILAIEKAELLIQENKYDEGIAQYKVALAMSGGNDQIRQEIARAYRKQCILSDENCEDALLVYNFLISTYPEDEELILERLELHEYLGDSAGMEQDLDLLKKVRIGSLLDY